MTVKRYARINHGSGCWSMGEWNDGEYVSYDDYAALQQKLETVKSLAGIAGDLTTMATEAVSDVISERNALQQQVNALAAENANIKSAFKAVHSSTEEAEIYGDGKYIVEPSEYEALADAVEETPATDAAIREIGAKAVAPYLEALPKLAGNFLNESMNAKGQTAKAYASCAHEVATLESKIRAGEQGGDHA